MIAFTTWLRAQQHRDDEVGDLARDYVRDSCARNIRKPESLLAHIYDMHTTSPGAGAAIERAVDEWVSA